MNKVIVFGASKSARILVSNLLNLNHIAFFIDNSVKGPFLGKEVFKLSEVAFAKSDELYIASKERYSEIRELLLNCGVNQNQIAENHFKNLEDIRTCIFVSDLKQKIIKRPNVNDISEFEEFLADISSSKILGSELLNELHQVFVNEQAIEWDDCYADLVIDWLLNLNELDLNEQIIQLELLGNFYRAKKQWERVQNAFEKLLKLRTTESAVSFLIESYLAQGKVNGAKEYANSIIKSTPHLFIRKSDKYALNAQKQRLNVVVAAAPKSASTFISSIFHEQLGLNLHDCYPGKAGFKHDTAIENFWKRFKKDRNAFVKKHFYPSQHILKQIRFAAENKVVVHLRDPRQIIYSQLNEQRRLIKSGYFDCSYDRDHITQRWDLDNPEILDKIIRLKIDKTSQFYNAWLEESIKGHTKVLFTSYESLCENKALFIDRILSFYGIPPFSLNKEISPSFGAHNFRVGKVDAWKSSFIIDYSNTIMNAIDSQLIEIMKWEY